MQTNNSYAFFSWNLKSEGKKQLCKQQVFLFPFISLPFSMFSCEKMNNIRKHYDQTINWVTSTANDNYDNDGSDNVYDNDNSYSDNEVDSKNNN